jgi:hypothetical protein
MQSLFKAEQGQDIELKVDRVVESKLEYVLFHRTAVSSPLTLELIFQVGATPFLIRRLVSFSGTSWSFVPGMRLPAEGSLIFRTSGAGGGDNHQVNIGISQES